MQTRYGEKQMRKTVLTSTRGLDVGCVGSADPECFAVDTRDKVQDILSNTIPEEAVTIISAATKRRKRLHFPNTDLCEDSHHKLGTKLTCRG